MAQDQVTYQRATSAALVGLLVQLALAVAVTLLALWAQSPVLSAASWHLYGGLFIWAVLALIYHQHRIEREESLEAERLAKSEAHQGGALFAEQADDLDMARRRLDRLYKWGLGSVSLIVAGYLLGSAIYLLYQGWQFDADGRLSVKPLGDQAIENPMVVIALSALPAFVAFIVARYVSGMTKVREWQLLRGGASYLMGFVALGALATVGAIFAAFESYTLLKYLSLAIPGIMGFIGIEILLTFLLSAYRPRKPGEIPRPAFDSRVLGWFTSPESLGKIVSETINYQFGFEVSRSWFYQLLGRSITKLSIFGILALMAVSTLVLVGPHQQAVITSFGKLDRIAEPGLSFKLPWPISRAKTYDVGRIHTLDVGSVVSQSKPDVAILWTNEHTEGEEDYLLTSPTPAVVASAADDRSGDRNVGLSLLAAEVVLQYRIDNLEQFVTSVQNPDEVLKALADRRITSYFVSHHEDELLTRGRVQAGHTLAEQIQKDADEAELGVRVVFVSMTGIHPPQKSEVALAYHEQVGALQEKETSIQQGFREANSVLAEVAGTREQALKIDDAIAQLEALRDAVKDHEDGETAEKLRKQIVEQEAQVELLLAQARGKAAELIYDARAYRWQRAVGERAKAERFQSELLAYMQAPDFYRMRQYLAVLAEGLADSRKVVLTVDQTAVPVFRLDLKDNQSMLDSILDK